MRHPSVVPRFWGAAHLDSLDRFDERRYPRRVGATIELLQSAVELTRAGAFLGYFPKISVSRYLARGELKALRGLRGLAAFELSILTRRGDALRPAAARLREIVAAHTARGAGRAAR